MGRHANHTPRTCQLHIETSVGCQLQRLGAEELVMDLLPRPAAVPGRRQDCIHEAFGTTRVQMHTGAYRPQQLRQLELLVLRAVIEVVLHLPPKARLIDSLPESGPLRLARAV